MTRRRFLVVVVILLIPVAMHAIWDQVEATLLAREVARIAQRHEPVNVATRMSALPTPEQRAAARVYAAAADLAATKFRDDPKLYNREDDLDRAFASGRPAEMLEDLRRRYVEGEPAFGLLAQASALDFAGFGPAGPELYENASPLVALNDLNSLRGDTLTARGNASASAQALMQSVRLQRTIGREYYRYLAARRWYGSLRLLLRHAPPEPETLLQLQQAIEQLPDDDNLVEQLRAARAQLLAEFWPYPTEGTVWAFRGRMSGRVMNGLAFAVLRPLFTRTVRNQLKPFEEAIEVARRPWPAKLDATDVLKQRYAGHALPRPAQRTWLQRAAAVFPPALGVATLESYVPIAGQNLAMRRTSIAAVAIERFRRAHAGEAPATLSALVPEYLAAVPMDPFSGQPLLYRRTAVSYAVYSIGQNRGDDGAGLYGLGSQTEERRANEGPYGGGDLGIRMPLSSRK